MNECKVEIGAMDYGIEIDGILGFDFMRTAGLIIDTNKMREYRDQEAQSCWFSKNFPKQYKPRYESTVFAEIFCMHGAFVIICLYYNGAKERVP